MPIIEVKVPDIGDFSDVTVIEVLVKVGDQVKEEQSLMTVESDKASMEVPSTAAGTVKELKVKVGDKVSKGSLILLVESSTEEKSVPTPAPVKQAAVAEAEAKTAPTQGGELVDVKVPDIGDFKDVTVIEIMAKVGEQIAKEQSLMTVESDKASVEIPSSAAGVLESFKVKVGDKVNMGDVIAVVKSGVAPTASAVSEAPSKEEATVQAVAAPVTAPVQQQPVQQQLSAHEPAMKRLDQLPYASPSIRKLAREFGVPLDEVKGSGDRGRIIAEDVRNFVAQVLTGKVTTKAQQQSGMSGGAGLDLLPWPNVDFTQFGEVESKPLSRIKKIAGANLHRNWVMIPHVTNNEEADITELEALRVQLNQESAKAKSDVKYTLLAFLIKACVAALKKFPEFNTSLQGDELVYKKYFNIGFAADTPNGLVVPVIKDADKKGISSIALETAELASKARAGKLGPADMSGGCFTISSLGGFGGTYFTPIINAPEVAILGVCRSSMKPVWDGKAFQPRLMLPLSLSYDHRVIDGVAAARFNAYLATVLADFRRVLI